VIDVNSHIDVIDKDLIAVNFQYVAMGFIKELSFIDTPGKALKKVVTISENGSFVINKPSDNQDFQQVVRTVKAIMTLKDGDIYTKHGFCCWVRGVVPSNIQYTDEQAMQVLKIRGCEEFWTIYWNLCEAEKLRRNVKKEWMQNHPLLTFKDFLKEKLVKNYGKHTNTNSII